MMLKAFAILDIKTGVYHPPMFFAHKGLALRAVIDAGRDMNSMLGRHPHDFRLIMIGEFDDNVGIMIPHSVPEDFGTIGALLPRERMADEMTAAEVVELRAQERAAQ